MRVLHVSKAYSDGGAAIAARRLHKAMVQCGVSSQMFIDEKSRDIPLIYSAHKPFSQLYSNIRPYIVQPVVKRINQIDKSLNSIALIPYHNINDINEFDVDVIHLHWVQGEMLSIADIPRINKPIVWTLHDMWPFSGSKHYSDFNELITRRSKFTHKKSHSTGIDNWVWKRKRKHWTTPHTVIAPSGWMAENVRDSALMGSWPVHTIPNTIDTCLWSIKNRIYSRQILGIDSAEFLLLMGALGGLSDERKGGHQLLECLRYLPQLTSKPVQLIVCGQYEPSHVPDLPYPIQYLGQLSDEISLSVVNSAVDAVIIPSLADNLPNTAIEAQVTGKPIIAFNIGGMPDIVTHNKTGYLAQPFDTEDLANGVVWALDNSEKSNPGSEYQIRNHALDRFSEQRVVSQHIEIYHKVIKSKKSSV